VDQRKAPLSVAAVAAEPRSSSGNMTSSGKITMRPWRVRPYSAWAPDHGFGVFGQLAAPH